MFKKYFITRRTIHENYKISKRKRLNNQKYYVVKFNEWVIGWSEFQNEESYQYVKSIEFEDKDTAKLFMEGKIETAYKELIK